ncbi:MAG: chromate transporter [Clostridia bacterium]|nr:chromate transporter [Clostridia bacterium]
MSEQENRSKRLLPLFLTFMKIGGFTFGGGYAMIPLIQKETVENKKWISDDDILEIIAIAESTPGPIAINSATFVGYRTAGVLGAMLATLGVVLPSFVVITLISFVLTQFQELRAVQYAFYGIRAGVLALIVKAFVSMYKKCPKGIVSYIVMVFAFVCAAIFDLNVMVVIICSAVFGLITTLVNKRRLDQK